MKPDVSKPAAPETEEDAAAAEALAAARAAEALAAARAVVAGLRDKLAKVETGGEEIAAERKKIAFSAHVGGDAEAGRRLDEIHRQAAELASHTASLADAITEAEARVAVADSAHQRAHERAEARQVLAQLAEARRVCGDIDAAAADFFSRLAPMVRTLLRLGFTGPRTPTAEMVRAAASRALLTAAEGMRALLYMPPLAPSERVSFNDLIDQVWAPRIERWAADRLAEPAAAERAR